MEQSAKRPGRAKGKERRAKCEWPETLAPLPLALGGEATALTAFRRSQHFTLCSWLFAPSLLLRAANHQQEEIFMRPHFRFEDLEIWQLAVDVAVKLLPFG